MSGAHTCRYISNDGYCFQCGEKRFAPTPDGQWPSDTWFRRAMARKLKRAAQELEKYGPPPKDQQ